jgi:hypothetical protein
MTENNIHNTRSSHREALLEHLFTGAVMKQLWLHGDWRLEVLKPQVDDNGYDLVLEANGIIRHVQLKSSFRGSKVRDVPVNILLAGKPGGCVVFLRFDQQTLDLGPFLFFERMPELAGMKTGKHTRANAQGVKAAKPNIRTVPLSKFEPLGSVEQVVNRLFGSVKAVA